MCSDAISPCPIFIRHPDKLTAAGGTNSSGPGDDEAFKRAAAAYFALTNSPGLGSSPASSDAMLDALALQFFEMAFQNQASAFDVMFM